MDAFIGQIIMVGFDFPPRNWAQCNGQLLPIAQNTALFSILGLTYGGDGRSTFALPDLRGRAPMHQGTGPGLTPVVLGQPTGSETTILLSSQMPAHNHGGGAVTTTQNCGDVGTSSAASTNFPGVTARPLYNDSPTGNLGLMPSVVAGGGQPHNNMQPYQVINFVIAMAGIFPSRT